VSRDTFGFFTNPEEQDVHNSEIPFVSVIIPVYNDPIRLKICLQALEDQTYPQHAYEVIVVDNGSDENIETIVAGFSQVKQSYEAYPGSYAARNKGLSLAQGKVIAFTDSDCIPAPDWIEKGVQHLLNMPEQGIVGGEVELFFQNPEQPTAVEFFDTLIMYFDQRKNVEQQKFSVTANLFTFKHIFDHVGEFDGTLKSRGDREWGKRASALNYPVIYAPDVRVNHPARQSFQQLRNRIVRLAGGFEDLETKNKALFTKQERQEFSLSLRPSLETFMRIWQSPLTVMQKIKVTLVGVAVKYIKVRERVHLKIWGKATR
jgi:glycosyltransferase involved in cell wall biosynthesis